MNITQADIDRIGREEQGIKNDIKSIIKRFVNLWKLRRDVAKIHRDYRIYMFLNKFKGGKK